MIKNYSANPAFPASRVLAGWLDKMMKTTMYSVAALTFIMCCRPALGIYDYITVKDLARRLRLSRRSDETADRQILSNGTTEVIVCPGLQNALVNGRLVSMAEKVTFHHGEIVMPRSAFSAIRKYTHIQSRGNSPEDDGGFSGVTVVLDPGHGGKDPGAVGPGPHGLKEKTVNLDVAKRAAAALRAKGAHTVLTRNDDSFIPLGGRVEIAKRYQPCIFVSIHADSAGDRTAKGFHILCVGDYYDPIKNGIVDARSAEIDPRSVGVTGVISEKVEAILLGALLEEYEIQGKKLASDIKSSMARSFLPHGSGITRDVRNLHVLREGRYPRVLIEVGFLSNPSYERKLNSSAYRQKIADALASGIINFLRSSHKHLRAKVNSRTARAYSFSQRGRKR